MGRARRGSQRCGEHLPAVMVHSLSLWPLSSLKMQDGERKKWGGWGGRGGEGRLDEEVGWGGVVGEESWHGSNPPSAPPLLIFICRIHHILQSIAPSSY